MPGTDTGKNPEHNITISDPLALAPMLMELLTDDRKSFILNVMNCIFISVAVNFDIQITIFALVNAVLGTMIPKNAAKK